MIKIHNSQLILTALIAIFSVGQNFAHAQDKVVVIPMAGDESTANSEVRTPISSIPITINTSGSYYLTDNLHYTGTGVAIRINASHVQLDMMGFTLSGPGKGTAINPGIYINEQTNVSIMNGTVREFGPSGIGDKANTDNDRGHRIINVRVVNNAGTGINLKGANHQVRGCIAQNNGGEGISVGNGLVIDNTSADNDSGGIWGGSGSLISGNVVYKNVGTGITGGDGATIRNNNIYTNHGAGIFGYGSNLIEGNSITENNIDNDPIKGGIVANENSRVVGNTLKGNNQYGIRISYGGSLVEGNHITNSENGISLGGIANAYRDNTVAGTYTIDFTNSGTDLGGNVSY